MKPQLDSLFYLIREIIQENITIRDVPYSRIDGAQEVDPESCDVAAKTIVEMIEKYSDTEIKTALEKLDSKISGC